MSLHFHPLRVRAIEPDTAEAVIVSFDVPDDLRERLRLHPGPVPHAAHATSTAQDLRRSYSICAGVDDGELRVGVRKVHGRHVLELDQRAPEARRHHPGDGAAGPLLRAARRRGARATTSASPAAAASRRSCRS